MSLLQNSYIFANLLIHFLLNSFLYFFTLKTPKNQLSLCSYHNEVLQINYEQYFIMSLLSINFMLYVIDLPLSNPFLNGTEKVIYFSVFSPKHSNCPSNSYASSLIIK